MATTQNQLIESRGAKALQHFPVAAGVQLPQGTLAYFDEGYLTNVAAGNRLAGFVKNEADNTNGGPGDAGAEVYMEGAFFVSGSGFSQATVGQAAYGIDNDTVTTVASGNSAIGRFVEYVGPTRMGVKLDMQQV